MLVACLLSTVALSAQQTLRLGIVTFPNSGSRKAQADFLRGVAWIHSFAYEDAIDAFRSAQKIDPNFALAYWGESLSFSQPLWFFEQPEKGRAALAKLGATREARLAKTTSPREQAFLTAIEALWGVGGDTAVRAAAYVRAMAKVAADNPADDEAQTFYALALLGTLPRGDASLPLRQQAGAIVERVFARNPNHPGAAHYLLHAYDHGTLPPKALAAARAYAKIVPAASHALHMPAHTFLQLGLWDEAAVTDEASWNTSVAWAARRGLSPASRDFHSLSWLQYEWTQQGRFVKTKSALALVDEAMTAKPGLSPLVGSSINTGGHHYADSGNRPRERSSGVTQRSRLDACALCHRKRAMGRHARPDDLRQYRRAVRRGIERRESGRRATSPGRDRAIQKGRERRTVTRSARASRSDAP